MEFLKQLVVTLALVLAYGSFVAGYCVQMERNIQKEDAEIRVLLDQMLDLMEEAVENQKIQQSTE